MMPRVVRTDDVPSQTWRNGGGTTRELLCWPSTLDCRVRISVADITRDGPFSSFPGIARWFAVVEGRGVALRFGSAERVLTVGDAPLHFDGAAAPGCRLIDGPTRDLNLMLQDGRGQMREVKSGAPWDAGFQLRGLYTTGTGRWQAGNEQRMLTAHTLLWSDASSSSAWSFDAHDAHAPAWWLGFTPDVPT